MTSNNSLLSAQFIAQTLGRYSKSGDGYKCLCPAHDDHNPSLSIKDDGKGGILAKCHRQCTQEEVVLALKSRNLWPERSDCKIMSPQSPRKYIYQDVDGTILYYKLRYEPKKFVFTKPNGEAGVSDIKRVPYNLPALVKAIHKGEIVFLVEGEKDCEIMKSHNFVATTNDNGGGNWRRL